MQVTLKHGASFRRRLGLALAAVFYYNSGKMSGVFAKCNDLLKLKDDASGVSIEARLLVLGRHDVT